jgi:hypothetical protein
MATEKQIRLDELHSLSEWMTRSGIVSNVILEYPTLRREQLDKEFPEPKKPLEPVTDEHPKFGHPGYDRVTEEQPFVSGRPVSVGDRTILPQDLEFYGKLKAYLHGGPVPVFFNADGTLDRAKILAQPALAGFKS